MKIHPLYMSGSWDHIDRTVVRQMAPKLNGILYGKLEVILHRVRLIYAWA